MQITFTYRETWLHRVNPGVKLILSILLFIVVVFTHNLNAMMYLTLGALVPLFLFSGHPMKRLLLYASPFLLIFLSSSTGMMMFGSGETLWYQLGFIRITEESFYRGIHLGFRGLQVAAVGLLFSLTTRPVALFYAMMQQWRVAPKYAYSFLAAMRMLPLMLEEFQTLRYALKVRGKKKRNPITGWYTTLRMYAIPLLAQSIRRAHRTAVAMEAKRFSAQKKRTYYYVSSYSMLDVYYIFYWTMLVILAGWLGKVWPFLNAADVR
ncbi:MULTISPECIES: energy-coupling factor transporter transmembrane protein EcfT [unclassified Paenibacillus]|uniref:energy-coupling factor transporter transmembrane component T family protein n=1 Tax=unclassified Paenibacillus TaxID=185978 RepID=UPI002787DE94|nr:MULTISPECIES: energy-coupling factor transporter transmembrane component T [unclassified Paenibacillus]MDQ0902687.1 energy-coupling factor transport system permease protein [Paenibacillus sp. V4I7]MDQ0918801.1 energy-coupling factor transport system permease protein [Paenibacillus sp. V4I5]